MKLLKEIAKGRSLRASRSPFFQAKLKVNEHGDRYEQEAESIAKRISDTGDADRKSLFKHQISRAPLAGIPDRQFQAPDSIVGFLQGNSSSGKAMPNDIQTSMESKFGVDFSEVKIHQDQQAENASRELKAKAFTYGNHLFFDANNFDPRTKDGRKLLAHELTHVVQQGATSKDTIQRDEDPAAAQSPTEEKAFEFDYDLLPPSIQFTIGRLMLEANTSEAGLEYTQVLMTTRFGYSYGGSFSLGTKTPSWGSHIGFNPHDPGLSLGFSKDKFSFSGSAGISSPSVGFNLGFGAKLLPSYHDLIDPVYGGWQGAGGIMGGLGSMEDPYSFYQSHSEHIDKVMGAVKAMKPLTEKQDPGIGVGLRFKYDPVSGALIHGGMHWLF